MNKDNSVAFSINWDGGEETRHAFFLSCLLILASWFLPLKNQIRRGAVLPCLFIVSSWLSIAHAQTIQQIGKAMSNRDSVEVKDLFFRALSAKITDNNNVAADLFEKVIQRDPQNDAAMYELANIKKVANNYDEALPLLQKAATIKPDNEWYWLALADNYEKSNDYAKLEKVFDQLIRINPEKADYYFDQANAYFFEAKYDEALRIYDKVESITGLTDDLLAYRQKIYLKQGKVDAAAKQLDEMIANNPSQIKYYLFLAELYTSNNFTDKGIKVLQNAEKINPNSGLVHLALADAYRDKKNTDASYNELTLAFAIPDVEIDQKIKIILGYIPRFPDPNAKASALELSRIVSVAHPNDSKAWAVYGDMLLQNNKIAEAKPAYQKSVALNNHVYEVQEQLVRIELSQNDIDGAIKDGENSLSMFPNQAWMNYLTGVALLQKKETKKALEYIKNATSLEFQDKDLLSQSYAALGDCYHTLGDNKKSDEAYDKSLSYNPDNSFTLNNYAYYLSLRGEQLDKAASMSKHSTDLQPNNASFEDTYAWILFRQKDYTNAKQWIEKALADDKDNSGTLHEHYGDILFYLGNIDGAVDNWKKAKASGGASPVLDRKINEKKYIE